MTDDQSTSLSWCQALIWGPRPTLYYCQTVWWDDRFLIYNCCWPLPVQSFLGPSPTGLMTIFYCLIFKTLQSGGNASCHGLSREYHFQQLFYCYVHVCCGQCLATGMFAEPFPSNGYLCWLRNSGFQQRCHNISWLIFNLVEIYYLYNV
jgi:hypothetical protein